MPILLMVFFLVLIIAIVVVGPFVTIWALNTLFGFKIAFTFWTWLASAWLSAVVGGTRYVSKNK